MTIERYEDRVTKFRKENPDCGYCICNINYNTQNKVPECAARKICCYDFKKIAKKCPLFEPRYFEESEYTWM